MFGGQQKSVWLSHTFAYTICAVRLTHLWNTKAQHASQIPWINELLGFLVFMCKAIQTVICSCFSANKRLKTFQLPHNSNMVCRAWSVSDWHYSASPIRIYCGQQKGMRHFPMSWVDLWNSADSFSFPRVIHFLQLRVSFINKLALTFNLDLR